MMLKLRPLDLLKKNKRQNDYKKIKDVCFRLSFSLFYEFLK